MFSPAPDPGEWTVLQDLCSRSVDSCRTAVDVDATCDDILSIVRTTLASSKRRWNNAARSIVNTLPAELLVECFSHLALEDRVVVCTVSSSWRALALAHASLWANIDVHIGHRLDIDTVRMSLGRAGAHPLALRFGLGRLHSALEPDVLELVYSTRDRLRSLEITNRDSVVLHRLQSSESILQELDVGPFSMTSDITQPFNRVVSFKGSVSHTQLDFQLLFRVFPNLEALRCYESYPPRAGLSGLPLTYALSSLLQLTFTLTSHRLIDYLPDLISHPLRPIHAAEKIVMGYLFFEISGAVGEVDHRIRSIRIGNYGGGGTLLCDRATANLFRPALSSLRYLLVSGGDSVAELLCIGWDLPRLEELVLEDPSVPDAHSQGTLFVPALRSLHLHFMPRHVRQQSLFLAVLPQVWPHFLRPEGLRVHSLMISRSASIFPSTAADNKLAVELLATLDLERITDYFGDVHWSDELIFCATPRP